MQMQWAYIPTVTVATAPLSLYTEEGVESLRILIQIQVKGQSVAVVCGQRLKYSESLSRFCLTSNPGAEEGRECLVSSVCACA